jgi:4-alpha-glucanotransferase
VSDDALAALAEAAGVAPAWQDVFGETHQVAPATLRAVLAALELPAHTHSDIAESHERLAGARRALPPLVTASVGQPVALPAPPGRYELLHEDGRRFDGMAQASGEGAVIPAILEPGYHRLILGDSETLLAVAPARGFTVGDAVPAGRAWGIAVQLYALRRAGDGGIGDFTALAEFARGAARHGAAAVAISPVHAQFSADPDRFSPYSPSSRTALNVLHTPLDAGAHDPALPQAWAEQAAALERLSLVDWPAAGRLRLARLRALFEAALRDPAQAAAFAAFRAERGEVLELHAIFEALHADFFGRDAALWHWRNWPADMQAPHGAAVRRFAQAHETEVAFHAYMQFLADRGLAHAQAEAKAAGMAIGLVTDLAVGTDSGGSHCWSRQAETLLGLTVGAPPDLLQRRGQNWGLAAFSPRGLRENGFGAYREMLRSALAHAGGMRIDHAMGLNRLWVIPEGATGAEGAYIAMPEQDLMRLVMLESARHRAIVLAEDLGTVPEGFSDRLDAAGMDGMRVLWFERDKAGNFVNPAWWTPRASAMTSTHDLATVAGWWSGADIGWRETLGQAGAAERSERDADRALLWQAFRDSGAAQGEPPPEAAGDLAADAACAHVGASACELVMLPLEDALALVEQPNVPGTLDEHPNWRRRTASEAGTILDDAAVSARLALLDRKRKTQ